MRTLVKVLLGLLVLLVLLVLGVMTGVVKNHIDYIYTVDGVKHKYVYGNDEQNKRAHQHIMKRYH